MKQPEALVWLDAGHVVPRPAQGIISATAAAVDTITTNSVAFVDMTNMTVTVNVPFDGATVLLLFNCWTFNGTLGVFNLWQFCEGATVLATDGPLYRAPVAAYGDTVSWQILLSSVTAGSHTYKIQWRVTANTATASNRRLIALVFP